MTEVYCPACRLRLRSAPLRPACRRWPTSCSARWARSAAAAAASRRAAGRAVGADRRPARPASGSSGAVRRVSVARAADELRPGGEHGEHARARSSTDAGLLVRSADPADRRVARLELRDEMQRKVDAFRDRRVALLRRAIGAASPPPTGAGSRTRSTMLNELARRVAARSSRPMPETRRRCCARACATASASTSRVDGVDLRIEQGEIFGLLGPNGAGKTTHDPRRSTRCCRCRRGRSRSSATTSAATTDGGPPPPRLRPAAALDRGRADRPRERHAGSRACSTCRAASARARSPTRST